MKQHIIRLKLETRLPTINKANILLILYWSNTAFIISSFILYSTFTINSDNFFSKMFDKTHHSLLNSSWSEVNTVRKINDYIVTRQTIHTLRTNYITSK